MIKKQGFKVSPRSIKEIRNIANVFVKHSKVKSFPIMHVLEIVLPKLYENFSLEIVDDAKMGDNHGLTLPNENIIKLKASVYLGACNCNGRDRYTVAHEIGHLILHRGDAIKFAYNENANIRIFEDSEWQANTFAAELLMPFDLVKEYNSVDDIVRDFDVSREAAEIRLERIRREQKKQQHQRQ